MTGRIIARAARQLSKPAIACAGAFLAAVLPGTASALDSQAAWQGIATTTASTGAQCAGVGGSVPTDAYVSIFRPKIASADTNTYLSFVFLRAALTLENLSESTARQMHGSGRDEIFGVNGRAKFFDGAGTYSLSISPAAITTATPVITITGKINNFFDVPGCDVTFTGVYAKRVD